MSSASHRSTVTRNYDVSNCSSLHVDRIYCKDSDQRRYIITGTKEDSTTVQLYKHGPTSSGSWGTTDISNIDVDLTDIVSVAIESGAASYGSSSTPFRITNEVFS